MTRSILSDKFVNDYCKDIRKTSLKQLRHQMLSNQISPQEYKTELQSVIKKEHSKYFPELIYDHPINEPLFIDIDDDIYADFGGAYYGSGGNDDNDDDDNDDPPSLRQDEANDENPTVDTKPARNNVKYMEVTPEYTERVLKKSHRDPKDEPHAKRRKFMSSPNNY